MVFFRIIFSSNVSDQNEKSFLFFMRSEEKTERDAPMITASNPNQLIYGVCFITNDYIELVF